MTNKERLCRTCIYGDKNEYDKPCVIYSDNCQLYEEKKHMTPEKAINTLKVILEEATETEDSICYVTSCDADALKAAIKALEQQPNRTIDFKQPDKLTGSEE